MAVGRGQKGFALRYAYWLVCFCLLPSADCLLSPFCSAQPPIETLDAGVRLCMDVPAGNDFDSKRPTLLVIYATPNGSTIEQTLGGKAAEGATPLDYRFDLQHVAAQVRRWREIDRRENIALAVVQASEKSWPAFRKAHPDAPQRERQIVAIAVQRLGIPAASLILTGHSGGGSFLWGYLDAADAIPATARRIAFLDANYSYSDQSKHDDKLLAWLRGDASRTLVVIAYDDREITFNGKKVVGPDGGTYRASRRMLERFEREVSFADGKLGPFNTFTGMHGQIRFFIHPNPENKILHTALVGEMNGLLEAMTVGTPEEGKWGTFGGPRAYTHWITTTGITEIPSRPNNAVGGNALMDRIAGLDREQREEQITAELLKGNLPEFLRQWKTIHITAMLADGKQHTAELRVMPDYLAVGSDADFVRVPLTPMAASTVADAFGCVMPTRKIVDEIYRQSELKLDPQPMTENREAVATFVQHNTIIEQQRKGHALGELIAGIKKDVVLTPRLIDSPGHVAIYGWHKLDGRPIQPLTTIHISTYVDYSHGIRLISRDVVIDGKPMDISEVLASPELSPLLSDEGPMKIATMCALKPLRHQLNLPSDGWAESRYDGHMHVVIFEGSQWSAFAPLSLGRPVFALASGASSLLAKQLRHLKPERLTLWVRPEMGTFCRDRILPHLSVPTQINQPLDNEPAVLFNGRVIHLGSFEFPSHEAIVVDEGDVIRLAYARRPGLGPEDVFGRTQRWLDLLELPHTMPQARLVDSLWDLIHWNDESLIEDFAHLHDRPTTLAAPGPYHLIQSDNIWLGPDVRLSPGCVLDASKGPIMIGARTTIGANAVINGPSAIGSHARIRPLAFVREGTSIGDGCTIGGEISHSIVLSHTNKGHEGFVGHSYIGKWVNLGAGTTTSNLKNTYGEIRARIDGKEVATGRQFLGSVIGDHSKTAILTRLSAGTYIGFSSMVAAPGITPRLVPSYTFLTEKGAIPYDMRKAIEVAKRVFARRDRQFNETDEQLMRYVAETAPKLE